VQKQIHILVELTPDRLERLGPVVPGWWSRPDDELGRRLTGEFLLDTGAYAAMIDADVAAALHLNARGTRKIHGIHGHGSLPQYLAQLILPAKDVDGDNCLFQQTIECLAVPGLTEKSRDNGAEVIGILGRGFLRRARLEIEGGTGRIALIIQR
jgi:hypothetical protein